MDQLWAWVAGKPWLVGVALLCALGVLAARMWWARMMRSFPNHRRRG